MYGVQLCQEVRNMPGEVRRGHETESIGIAEFGEDAFHFGRDIFQNQFPPFPIRIVLISPAQEYMSWKRWRWSSR